MSLARPVVFLLAAACLIWVGRCSSPTPGQPSQDSLALAHAARQIDTVVQTVTQTVQRLDTVIRWRERRTPPSVPPRPDSVDSRTDSLYARISYDSQTIVVLDSALRSARDTLASVRDRLRPVPAVLDRGAEVIGRLERRRAYPWAAGVLLEGATPVGGWVSRDVWRGRVSVEVTGPEAVVRIGLGIRF